MLVSKRLSPFLVAALVLALRGTAAAQAIGGYAGGALRRTVLAREIGMGGAFDPFHVDGSAIFSNAAALATLDHASVTAGISTLPFGERTALLGAGYGVAGLSGIGISILRYGQANISNTNLDGRPLGTFDYQQLAIGIGGGLAIGPGAVGATVHYLRDDYTGISAGGTGYTIDLSGTLALRDYYFAFSLNNVAGEIHGTYDGAPRDLLPWNARLDAVYLEPLSVEIDRSRPDPTGMQQASIRPTAYWLVAVEARVSQIDSIPSLGIAGEVKPFEKIPWSLRLGCTTLGDVSAGFSYAIATEITPELRLDYAVRRDFELGDITHHVTFTASFP